MAAKTLAEEKALEYAEKNGLNVVTVCPCLVLGPLLQPAVSASNEFFIYVIKVNVRDVADALLLVYEKAESSGRYLCAPDRVSTKDLLNILKKTHPNYNCVNCDNDSDLKSIITRITSEKLKNLGWKPRTIEETLSDSIEYYEKAGLLQDVEGCPCRLPHPFHLAIDK
ncbi:putative anthocyanidin reductase isoform X2 [Setaria italica]|uniref:putative anthocyanidin reductase isoform X2 n=1 Tax=Setaria italica TaxID=4555 RepID=UPI000BE5243B|nr:putative anthocyanidin reductase isoform X2 [Setaria italica]